MLEWYVYTSEFNSGEIVKHNIEMNWKPFCDYVWAHRADLRRREKKNGNT